MSLSGTPTSTAEHLPSPANPSGALRRQVAGVGLLPTVTALLLATTMLLALRPDPLLLGVGAVVLVFSGSAAWVLERRGRYRAPRAEDARRPRRPSLGRSFRAIVDLALYLSPVLLLTFIFPIAVARITGVRVGGVSLTTLLLASSLTVPWLSMAVCLPLYRAVGHLIPVTDMDAVRARFTEVWPVTYLQSVPSVLFFAIPVEVFMRWSATAVLTYVALCLLHAAFAQSLVVVNIGRDRVLWACSWVGYATALLLLPSLWFLPPVVGLLVQLVPLRSHLSRLRSWARLDYRDVAQDLVRGTLLGSVLWAHLLFLFVKTQAMFAVTVVFLAVLPAVLAYNYYFVRLAPVVDQAVLGLRASMENEPHAVMSQRSSSLSDIVLRSISRTAFVGAVLCVVVGCLTDAFDPSAVALVGTAAVASWLFLMTTLLCYKLDYIGQRRQAQWFSVAHLVMITAAFALLPVGAGLYAWLIAVESVVFAGALCAAVSQWRTSEYALFWRHATAW